MSFLDSEEKTNQKKEQAPNNEKKENGVEQPENISEYQIE